MRHLSAPHARVDRVTPRRFFTGRGCGTWTLRTAVDAVEHGLGELASALKTHQSATFRPCWSCHKRPVGLGRQERAVVNAHEREGLTLRAGARGGR